MNEQELKNLTNTELKLHVETLKNEYETVKHEIMERFSKLDDMDKEYNMALCELNNRRNRA
jgi:hypothetical protein